MRYMGFVAEFNAILLLALAPRMTANAQLPVHDNPSFRPASSLIEPEAVFSSARGNVLVRGQSPDGDGGGAESGEGDDLTTQANDPTAALIQFATQNFFETESYEGSGFGYRFTIQPVIPIQKAVLGFDYMIMRPTIPFPAPTVDPDGPAGPESGMGDIFLTHFFIKKTEALTYGIGPIVNFPTATHASLGLREWQLGPAVVVITAPSPKWLIGALVLAPFSLESSTKSIQLQPLVRYFLPDDWYLSNGQQLWNWQTDSGNFSMPITFAIGKVLKQTKPYPLNIYAQTSYTPDSWHQGPAPKWQFLLNVTFLLPGG